MAASNSTLFDDLQARGIVYQTTDPGLPQHLQRSITLYCGFDPSADALHVGSLFPLVTLRRFQQAGHRPIVVLGGATGRIGDPSFKATERSLLTDDQVAQNLAGIRRDASRFLDFSAGKPNAALMIDNADFYRNMDVLSFLRDVGKFFTVNSMIAKDSVRSRMEDRDQGISYTEFSYSLLQGYDFYRLYRDYQCTLQIGASDQWGNITAGTELIRKKTAAENVERTHAFGLTHPLITKSDGTKFGKTESGTIWLDPKRTSPYQFYQFFISAPDDRVVAWLKYLTFLPLDQIQALEQSVKTEPEKKAAQMALARELTTLVHGADALKRAEAATQALFGTEVRQLDLQTLNEVFQDAPSTQKPKSALVDGISLIDLLAETGLFQSKGAARKEIPAGGVYINNERCLDPSFVVKPDSLIAGTVILLRKGKKSYHLVRFVD